MFSRLDGRVVRASSGPLGASVATECPAIPVDVGKRLGRGLPVAARLTVGTGWRRASAVTYFGQHRSHRYARPALFRCALDQFDDFERRFQHRKVVGAIAFDVPSRSLGHDFLFGRGDDFVL